MTVTTDDLVKGPRARWVDDWVELLSSMRFAISLLTVICVASVIGTVLKQHEPLNNYVNQFGPFWSEVFGKLDLYAVYSAWWFLLILAFLVASTTLCIVRNTPKILSDFRTYKENIREQSLKAFGHKAEANLSADAETEARRIGGELVASGWQVKLQSRQTAAGEGWMVAAKSGMANKLGYLAAHSAIVLVCIGGLLDGDLIVRAQMWFNGKSVFDGGGLISDVPAQHRLPTGNPTFRGNLLVTEGRRASAAVLSQPNGILLQDLPFSVELKKFVVDYYATGMPKLFASDIVIHDNETGEAVPARVEVNHPAKYKGIEIFQSSFDDGGSALKLKAFPMTGESSKPFMLDGVVGGSSAVTNGPNRLTIEFTGLRVINVENFGATGESGADVKAVNLQHAIESRLGAANKTSTEKVLRNIGPSITYKLRDAAGQATEFNNYMQPVDIDGARVFLLGSRESGAEPYRYLRIPADENDSLDGWMRLRAALKDAALRDKAVKRYVALAVDPGRPELAQALGASAQRAMALFAGVDAVVKEMGPDAPKGGLQAVSQFMETNVPEAERERAGEVLVRILNGVLFELNQVAREQQGLKPSERNDAASSFTTQAVLSLSDSFFYSAPMALVLEDFTHVQASVFQVSRAPGKTIVYLGCFFLVLGVFVMLYVRERRLWVWLAPAYTGAQEAGRTSSATMAMSSNRKTMETDKEFEALKRRLLSLQ